MVSAIQVVKAAGSFPRQLHMAGLVFTHWHILGAVNQNVGRLQQRVAQKSIGGQIFVLELHLLVFVSGYPLKPAQRRAHSQQGKQLGMLGHAALQKQGALVGVQACSQPVDHHFIDVLFHNFAVGVMGGQCVPVGDEEKALHFGLQTHPIFQRAVVVAQVQRAGRAHAR